MGNFIRAIKRHDWFNPANQQKGLKLATRIEKHLERDPEAYPAEFYRFMAAKRRLGSKDNRERLRFWGCLSCDLKTKR